MMTKTTAIIPVDQNLLLERLQELLEKQIKLLRKGDPAGKKFEELSFQADALVKKITQQDFFRSVKFAGRKKQLQKLYDCLYMAISAQKDETARQLNRLRKGKKTIVMYHKNI